MGRKIIRLFLRIFLVLFSAFAITPVFPACLYQTNIIQEFIMELPKEGAGDPVIIYWSHVIGESELTYASIVSRRFIIEYEDSDFYPECRCDIWLKEEGELIRIGPSGGSTRASVQIFDGCMQIESTWNMVGSEIVVFMMISGPAHVGFFHSEEPHR
ncbi:MAG TPA: hypothetical protein VMX75_03775 [Spirochaetia bacterium]|nr:hypothetical protein [Spirochaetia bacterium]